MSRLKERYKKDVIPALQDQFKYGNVMEIPRLKKIVINMGLGDVCRDKNAMQDHLNELKALSGQQPIFTRARKSVAGFKTRAGMPIGLKVTLRGNRMYEFADRLFNIVSPRIRDFRGFKAKGDGSGNVTLGIDDQQIFPEIDLDKVKRTQGMHITFVTSASTDKEGIELLRQLGLPFKNLPVVVAK